MKIVLFFFLSAVCIQGSLGEMKSLSDPFVVLESQLEPLFHKFEPVHVPIKGDLIKDIEVLAKAAHEAREELIHYKEELESKTKMMMPHDVKGVMVDADPHEITEKIMKALLPVVKLFHVVPKDSMIA